LKVRVLHIIRFIYNILIKTAANTFLKLTR